MELIWTSFIATSLLLVGHLSELVRSRLRGANAARSRSP